ncbi:MAG: molybdate transport system substrate-binding protein [Motiliproteus sp.]|jgi:molybdate transport system substrate-binding protein
MTFRCIPHCLNARRKPAPRPGVRRTLLLILAVLLPWQQAAAGQLLVAVAANFIGASTEIVRHFEAATGHRVKLSYGSSGKLYSQLEHGAPFEVFLAADRRLPQQAIAEGLAVTGSDFGYARGTLVLWSRQPGLLQDPAAYLRAANIPRIAIANPRIAPYGLAAQQVLSHLGIWDQRQALLVRGDSVAQAFQFTATGNAQVGFVALSQVQAWGGKPGSLWIIPESYYRPIDQHAVLLNKGQYNPVARQFLRFLKGPEAQRIIRAYGYSLPI